jgi:UDP-apiose/xylose synthase
MIDVSSSQFYGEGYDDSDKRIPDMTIINKQLGICFGGLSGMVFPQPVADGLNMDWNVGWNPKTPLKDLLETTLTYQHKTYKEAVKRQMSQASAST